ncbi:unnamed protein product [Periconia digitata]|uniref:Uncharacterized protein n=1 Tax=Periconia digitata TaxID=1303443 RepID=A0A9W4XR42_9PLEO|nr:unnamed protein product [Periconia digitata]
MNTMATAPTTPFFSFGPEDSFISKNYEGLRYRHLPPSLHDLIIGGSVLDVYWASLGPIRESWVLSFKDATGKHNLAYGTQISPRLLTHLKKVNPSPLIRTFLGPSDSYVFWDPTSLRWANLPASLEDAVQAWLTPAGWKAGPPRIVTWGEDDAFFAMSEYGNVAYRLGRKKNSTFPNHDDDIRWEIWRETVEEWRGERGFVWSEVAYISLDPSTPDQFIAIRNDGTWAGSIDDINEEALSAFSANFFRLSKQKQKNKPPPSSSHQQQHRANGNSTAPEPKPDINAPPHPATQAIYERWATETATVFAAALAANNNPSSSPIPSKKAPRKLQIRSQSSTSTSTSSSPPPAIPTASPPPALLTSFPYLPLSLTTCTLPSCATGKADPKGLRACKHDVERLLRASGLYSYEWLRQERIRWHPDRFGRLCAEEWREEGRRVAEEMFKVVDCLVGEVGRGRG